MAMWKTLYQSLDRACRHYRDRVAIIDGERSVSYEELGQQVNRVANGLLGLGVGRGESVAMLMPNSAEYVATQQGIWKAGAVMVQMASRASAGDLLHFLDSSGATTLIYHSQFDDVVASMRAQSPGLRRVIRIAGSDAEAHPDTDDVLDYADVFAGQSDADPEVDVQPDDLAHIMFTSGSTGQPKGVRHTHRSWSSNAITSGLEIGDIRPGEVFAHAAPLTHYTQIFLLPTFMRGGTTVILPGMDIDLILDAIEKHRVTATALVPTVIYQMLAHPRRKTADLSSVRTVVYAGSPMAPDRLREAIGAFGPVFVQGYAGTEPGFMTCLRKEDHAAETEVDLQRLSSAGRVMYHVELSVQDESDRPVPTGVVGEICSRQDGRMDGYVDPTRNSEALRDGWVHSGDIGYIDDDGYVYVVDRKKDMVVTGGFNVYPRQIEDVLLTHDGVAQCAVIGVPDDKWGEAVKAVVVRAPGSAADADELIALVKAEKGSVWAPKTVDFVEDLPVNASGKIDKKSIKAAYWAGQDRLVH